MWKCKQDAFEELKRRLTEAPVLACQGFNKGFVLQTDASDIGFGAVLTQRIQDEERVIAFTSRRLLAAEENYLATGNEVIIDHFARLSIDNPTGRVARQCLIYSIYGGFKSRRRPFPEANSDTTDGQGNPTPKQQAAPDDEASPGYNCYVGILAEGEASEVQAPFAGISHVVFGSGILVSPILVSHSPLQHNENKY